MAGLLRHSYLVTVYYVSWVFFGVGGLLLNIGCAFLLPFRHSEKMQQSVRAVIRFMFSWWVKWCHASRSMQVTWSNVPDETATAGTIYVANHPTLVDAPVILSALPETICIFKPALLRNPCVGPAAIMAGYASGDSGVDLIRDAAEQVASGKSLLIFPEGTRTTPGNSLNPLKPGFALIAKRAQAPIRLITIYASPGLTCRGQAWWKTPTLPAWMKVTFVEEIPADTEMSAAEITSVVQERLASVAGIVQTSARNATVEHPPRSDPQL